MLITVRVTGLVPRRFAKPGGLADERLIDVFPERPGVDEHLVVKPGRQEPRQHVVDHADIVFQRWEVVLGGGVQPVEDLGCGGALVRLERVARPEVYKRIGLFRSARHDAARAVVFKAAPHQRLPIGQKCGGQRVALTAFDQAAIELERHRPVAVDQAAMCGDAGAHMSAFALEREAGGLSAPQTPRRYFETREVRTGRAM